MKQARDAIIRPRRKDYDIMAIPFNIEYEGQTFVRIPLTYVNQRNQKILGSLYYQESMRPNPGDTCVVYLHGNASCQLEGRFLVPNFCPQGISVFCFDFAGCGRSDGEFISLGYFESIDTSFLIDRLVKQFGFSKFALWGRSMGAATAIMTENKRIVAKVVDSSYISVASMVDSIAEAKDIPSFFRPVACWFIKNSVDSAADFDFESVSPLESIKKLGAPIVIGHARDDKIIPFSQAETLYKECKNMTKLFMPLPGGHNSQRPLEWIRLCVYFCMEQLGIEYEEGFEVRECRSLQLSDAHFATASDMISNKKKKNKKRRSDSEDGDDGVRGKHRRVSSSSSDLE